jgi:hypothetical protein
MTRFRPVLKPDAIVERRKGGTLSSTADRVIAKRVLWFLNVWISSAGNTGTIRVQADLRMSACKVFTAVWRVLMCSELLNGEFGSLVILDRAEVLSLIDVPRSWGDSPQQQQAGKEHVSSRRDQGGFVP